MDGLMAGISWPTAAHVASLTGLGITAAVLALLIGARASRRRRSRAGTEA